jgi:hypothetical protein
MPGLINDFLRNVIARGIAVLGFFLQRNQRFQIASFTKNQKRLRQRYGITSHTPVLTYGSETEQLINNAGRKLGRKAMFAKTSGSTGRAKHLLYSKQRLNALKRMYIDVFARTCWSLGIRRTSLYVFSSFTRDESLTTMLLDDRILPTYLTTLQAPYRIQCDNAITELVKEYGNAAVRLWLLTISNPGVLYSTNPSSIVSFLDETNRDWLRSRQLVKDWHERRDCFSDRLQKIAKRIDSRGSAERMAKIVASDSPLSLTSWAPNVRAYICWTGGYVKPFLDRLMQHLPQPRYTLIPMYSMSTETVETLTCFLGRKASFLPIAKDVLYEFIEEGNADEPSNLLTPAELQTGKSYSMVVSDAFGLRRYQTDDLFLCDGTTLGLPNLSFLRRRQLEYSFTGEKLTAEQLNIVFQQLRQQYPVLFRETFLTCIPCQPQGKRLPHYRILAVGTTRIAVPDFSEECDRHLCELNVEYRSKRLSGRLGAVTFQNITTAEFSQHMASNAPTQWETQFKLLPLYREVCSGAV